MARLLEEILLYAKPMKLKLRIIDMAEFLLQFLEGHGDYASARRQKSSWSIQPGENRAMVDPDRMTQVLLNLANNAAEAAPEQGTIHWEITRNQEARTLTLSITNTAPPIPEEILSRLFDPFFTTKANGTGLGLGIIKRILDAHGGEIEISSSQPEGTRVAFQLPLD
jgi:signal transduction histidine kinase